MGRARLWGTAEWERRTPACSSFQAFASELQKVFGVPSRGPDLHGSLIGLRQGGQTVADYSIDFRTRVHRSEWNAAAQCDAFLVGLEDYVKDRPYPGGRKTPLFHVREQLGHGRRASGEWRLPRERRPVNKTAGLVLLVRDAAGQSGLTQSTDPCCK
ncbi:Retrotransposon-derived protein PEG10 [Merluccius polli]|uniref:Retrotransposon-derived protein PEG10 n=1 Tax=Merluccius polli TaxID=89951 RepID=A0AA47P7Y5_MERPO|nr:Retrotransposon-derived protein PEG10 [Merluccius polli]